MHIIQKDAEILQAKWKANVVHLMLFHTRNKHCCTGILTPFLEKQLSICIMTMWLENKNRKIRSLVIIKQLDSDNIENMLFVSTYDHQDICIWVSQLRIDKTANR